MKHVLPILMTIALLGISAEGNAQTYRGAQYCQPCHSSSFTQWKTTLHSKIHEKTDTVTVRPVAAFTRGDTLSMGASYNNAKMVLRRSGNNFFARVGLTGQEYRVSYTYGWGYKQRYLVKIDTSYYMLPAQYNLIKYLDNSTVHGLYIMQEIGSMPMDL